MTATAIDATLARDRAGVVARDVRGKLGGTPRIEIVVAAERIGRGDVRIALADSELTASMTVENSHAGD